MIPKFLCPLSLSIGSENDEDSVSFVCSICDQLHHTSNNRRTRYKKFLLGVFALCFVGAALYYYNPFSGTTANTESTWKLEMMAKIDELKLICKNKNLQGELNKLEAHEEVLRGLSDSSPLSQDIKVSFEKKLDNIFEK